MKVEPETASLIKQDETGVHIVAYKNVLLWKWRCRLFNKSVDQGDKNSSNEKISQRKKQRKVEENFHLKVRLRIFHSMSLIWKKKPQVKLWMDDHRLRYRHARVYIRKCWYKFYWRAWNKHRPVNAFERLQSIREMWFYETYGANYLCWRHRTGQ